MFQFDIRIFDAINSIADKSALLNFFGVFFAEYVAYILLAVLVVLWFFPKNRRRLNRTMIKISLLSALIARFILKEFIILFYRRPRPYIVLHGVHKLITTSVADNYQSFPSGHALFFFALATSLLFFHKKLGVWYFAAAILMGIARIFVGVHWPTDVISGAVLGILVAFGVQQVFISGMKMR